MKKEKAIKGVTNLLEMYEESVMKLLSDLKDNVKYEYGTRDNSLRITIKSGKMSYTLSFLKYRTPDVWTHGTHNRTKDGKYVLYLDYDMVDKKWIKDELTHLQEVYDLGDVHVFQSSKSKKGFHAISFAKLTAREYMDILENCSCDFAFKKIPRHTSLRGWVLRHFKKGKISKPTYLYTLKRNTKRQHSLAHYNFFKLLYPKIKQKINSDGITKLYYIKYATGGNVD